MDLEEERIRHRLGEREKALKLKVTLLKQRVERIKQMADVKAMVEKQPALMVAGSMLTGFAIKKLTSKRRAGNHRFYSDRADSNGRGSRPVAAAPAPKLRDYLFTILAGVASRTAMNVLSDLAKQMIPGKYDVRRAEKNFRDQR